MRLSAPTVIQAQRYVLQKEQEAKEAAAGSPALPPAAASGQGTTHLPNVSPAPEPWQDVLHTPGALKLDVDVIRVPEGLKLGHDRVPAC